MPPFPKAESWFDIRNVSSEAADVYIYDVIGETWEGEGVTAKKLIGELSTLKNRNVTVHINSPGGNVWDGFAIYNALLMHEGEVNVSIEGHAASAASTIAMAGKKIRMSSVSALMIHNPTVAVWGGAAKMRNVADSLDVIKEAILNSYKRAKKTREELSQAMDRETWFSPEDSLEWGLVDEVVEGSAPVNFLTPEIARAFNFSAAKQAQLPRLTPRSLLERRQRLNEALTKYTHTIA